MWGCSDHEEWNKIRRNLVLDSRWYAYAHRAQALRDSGTRRFFYPTAEPLPADPPAAAGIEPPTMLRRFELYSLRPDASPGSVAELERALATAPRFIPGLRHSRVGRNRSPAPVQLVWEHWFDSVAAYRRYMAHPYHAAVIDRFLLSDSPERIVTDNDLGAGLVGYSCSQQASAVVVNVNVRRLVLLSVDRRAPVEVIRGVEEALGSAPASAPEMLVSRFAANSLGAAWFDGETAVGPPPTWTHLWEQGYASEETLARYRRGGSALAAVERQDWKGWSDGVVRRAVEVHYDLPGDLHRDEALAGQ